jgi:hypothetical protein
LGKGGGRREMGIGGMKGIGIAGENSILPSFFPSSFLSAIVLGFVILLGASEDGGLVLLYISRSVVVGKWY